MAEFRQLAVAGKKLPDIFAAVVPFMRECVHAGWAGYMGSECTCFDDSSTIKPQSTFRLGASWASQLNGDIANLADLDD